MNAVDTHDLIERAAHLARLGWAVEKLAANAVEFHIDTIRATAAALEWPDLAHAVDKGGDDITGWDEPLEDAMHWTKEEK